MHRLQKQVVITSDKHPNEIGMDDRMRGRFSMGFQAQIDPPTVEEKYNILMQKADELKVVINDDTAFYIADNISTSDVRDLIGVLNRIRVYVSMYKEPASTKLARRALEETKLLKSNERRIVSPEALLNSVSAVYNIKPKDMLSEKRTRSVAHPRQVAMYLMRENLKLSLTEIAEFFGKKDHATVSYAVNKVKKELKDTPHLNNIIKKINESI
jgi:chromosomal replication initiator protein